MIYTITKATTTYETYSISSDSIENAIKQIEIDQSHYLVDIEDLEPEYVIVNVE